MRTPKTKDEWQEAVDLAEGCLALDAARQYGLIVGGPIVDFDRCCNILKRGRLRGIDPSEDAIERVAREFIKEK
jgi:DNA helicase HerA-like ATPase